MRQDELTDHELDLAGKVLQVRRVSICSLLCRGASLSSMLSLALLCYLQIAEVMEEIYPDDKIASLLNTKEGMIGRENVLAREAALTFDPREYEDGDIDKYWDIPSMAVKYESILQKYGFSLLEEPMMERIEPPEPHGISGSLQSASSADVSERAIRDEANLVQ